MRALPLYVQITHDTPGNAAGFLAGPSVFIIPTTVLPLHIILSSLLKISGAEG
jgi:hypothetical protein